jgi:hypothetical protein
MTTDLFIGKPQVASLKKYASCCSMSGQPLTVADMKKDDFTRRDRLANE